ncbi:MAG TPA: PilZ domain-containing protein, partial [Humisphaera sp.]|nr:PilZ domain-containing protein [Humisphaera sp.]
AAEITIMRSRIGTRPRSARGSKSQRRRTKRNPANMAVSLWRYIDGVPCNPESAVIIDVSTVGIGLILAAAVEQGTEFLINVAPSDASLVYRAVQCRPHGAESHRVGAEFVHHLPGANMASLEQDIERIRQAILG